MSDSTSTRLHKLTQQVDDITQLLRSQRETLKQRGMSLPTGSLDNLSLLRRRVDTLNKHFAKMMTELGQLRALAETTALINSAQETDSVLNQVIDTVLDLTGAERGYIVLKDRASGKFDQFQVARGGIDPSEIRKTETNQTPDVPSDFVVSRTIVNDVARTGEAVLTDNASQDTRYQSQNSIVGFGLRSILCVPLKVRDEVIGVVYCDNRIMAGLFQDSDLDILTGFSDQAAVAIENARLFEQAREQLAQLTEMRDLMDNVFDSIANSVITVDADNKIIACNAAGYALLRVQGDNADTILGRDLLSVLPAMGKAFDLTLKQVRADGEQRLIEVEPDGRYWNVLISGLRGVDGMTQGLTLVLDDLTETRKRASQLLELRRYLPGALVDKFRHVDQVNMAGQERVITAIATDVRGFTSFSEKLAPEKLMEIINRYLSLASDGINLYEGIVDKYMGDAVTGLFNTQLNPQEDHAIRAVRAAMSIIYDLYALHEIMPEDQRLFYGIGIHTGPAYLGNVGSDDRQEFAAMGEASTIAKLLESNANPGEILISPATFAQVEDFFDCEMRQLDKTAIGADTAYKVLKRKKGVNTSQLFLDPELADLLADLKDD
jgi:adenylate cyclase